MNARRKIFISASIALQFAVTSLCYASAFVTIQPKFKVDTVSAPDPTYPPYAEMHGHGGQGIFRLIINEKTGIVDQVQVFKSTGHSELNAEAVMTLFKWKFKPGIKQRDVSVLFEGAARSRQLH